MADNDFAICPRGGPPRLFRFDVNDDRILCELDKGRNILHINRYLFNRLQSWQQQEVYKTHATMMAAD